MKRFDSRQVREAIEYAGDGGQALHVWNPGKSYPDAPACFNKSRKGWGHLLDNDEERLVLTARRLGVRRIVVAQRGKRGQHVDLCGKPLKRAIKESIKDEG